MDFKEISIIMRNWVDSAEDRDYWRAIVNSALKVRVPKVLESVRKGYTCLYFAVIVHYTKYKVLSI